jgi:hypothetical protein
MVAILPRRRLRLGAKIRQRHGVVNEGGTSGWGSEVPSVTPVVGIR